MAGDMLSGLQLAAVFQIGGDAGAPEGMAADLIGIKPGIFGSPLDHVQDVIGSKPAAGELAGASFERLKQRRIFSSRMPAASR